MFIYRDFVFRYYLFVGDVVVLKDLKNLDKCLIRRLVGVEGFEMVWVMMIRRSFLFLKRISVG